MNTNKTPMPICAVIIIKWSYKMLYNAPGIIYLNNMHDPFWRITIDCQSKFKIMVLKQSRTDRKVGGNCKRNFLFSWTV